MITQPQSIDALPLVIGKILDKMKADIETSNHYLAQINLINQAITEDVISSGVAWTEWKSSHESAVIAAIGPGLIQMMRLGKDNQLRGKIWLIKSDELKVSALAIDNGVNDYSSYETLRTHSVATTEAIQNFKDAQWMSQKVLGKVKSNYQEPRPPQNVQTGS